MYIGTAKCAANLTPLRPFVPELWALKSRRPDHQSFGRILVLRTQHSAHTSTSDTGTIPWAKRSCILRLLGSMVGERLIPQLVICDLICENQPLPANSSLEKISSKVGVVT